MSGVEPGWYPDPAAPETQRYWDGEQWLGAPLPVGAPTPTIPPAPEPPSAPAPDATLAPDSGPQAILPQYPRVPTTFPTRPPLQDQPPGYGGPGGSPAFPPPPGPRPPAFPQQPGFPPQPGGGAQFVGGVQLAPLSARIGARLIDLLVLMALNVVVNGYFFVRYYQESAPVIEDALKSGRSLFEIAIPAEAQRLNLIMVLVAIGLWFAYEVPTTASRGQTLGKRVLGIKVARLDGAELRFGQAIRRWFILSFPAMLGACGWPVFLVNVLWCVWDRPAQQCLHDKAVRTIVVVAQPQQPPAGPGATRADVNDDNQARLD